MKKCGDNWTCHGIQPVIYITITSAAGPWTAENMSQDLEGTVDGKTKAADVPGASGADHIADCPAKLRSETLSMGFYAENKERKGRERIMASREEIWHRKVLFQYWPPF